MVIQNLISTSAGGAASMKNVAKTERYLLMGYNVFWIIPIQEESKRLTSFVSPNRKDHYQSIAMFYEFHWNAETFQNSQNTVQSNRRDYGYEYTDLIFSKTTELI